MLPYDVVPPSTWNQWHDVVQTVLAFVVGPSVAYGVWLVRGIRREMRGMEDRLIVIETWRSGYERMAQREHVENLARLDRIQSSIDGLRVELTAAILRAK